MKPIGITYGETEKHALQGYLYCSMIFNSEKG